MLIPDCCGCTAGRALAGERAEPLSEPATAVSHRPNALSIATHKSAPLLNPSKPESGICDGPCPHLWGGCQNRRWEASGKMPRPLSAAESLPSSWRCQPRLHPSSFHLVFTLFIFPHDVNPLLHSARSLAQILLLTPHDAGFRSYENNSFLGLPLSEKNREGRSDEKTKKTYRDQFEKWMDGLMEWEATEKRCPASILRTPANWQSPSGFG